MSAYGAIERSWTSQALRSTLWKGRASNAAAEERFVVLFHLTEEQFPDGLIEFMHNEFADEIERGQTYPQESVRGSRYTLEAFKSYFFAADVFVGILCSENSLGRAKVDTSRVSDGDAILEIDVDLPSIRDKRSWEESVAGFYYVRNKTYARFACN